VFQLDFHVAGLLCVLVQDCNAKLLTGALDGIQLWRRKGQEGLGEGRQRGQSRAVSSMLVVK
jgi:hypothetical protein